MQTTSIERGTITQKDLDEALGESHATPEVLCVSLSHRTCQHSRAQLLAWLSTIEIEGWLAEVVLIFPVTPGLTVAAPQR